MDHLIESIKNVTGETVMGGLAGCAGIYLAFKRLAVRAATEDVSLSEAKATTTVIQMLRDEVERLSTTNARLINELRIFQVENAKLTRKVAELSDALEDMKIKLEIVSIRGRKADRAPGEERRHP